jgi:hypothetical protein
VSEHRWCRVYWGTHGCRFARGHKGQHECDCGAAPYYGRWTRFYGEDTSLFNRVVWHVRGWEYRLRERLGRPV